MIVVPARILKAPKLEYGNKRIVISEDASWNLKGVKFYRPQRLENWSFLRCGRSSLSQKQVQTLHGQIEQYGLGNAAPSPAEGYHATLGQSDDDKTDEALEIAFLKAKKDGVKFLFVILETKSKPIHARLKFWADTKIGKHFHKPIDCDIAINQRQESIIPLSCQSVSERKKVASALPIILQMLCRKST